MDGGGTASPGGLRFHWRLPLAGEEPGAASTPPPGVLARALPDLPSHLAFCRLAEEDGIDSLLMACRFYIPDPVPLVAALGTATRRIRFMLAYRSGLIVPTGFVQQVNTLAALTGGRVSLNMVVGHSQEEQRSYGDFLSHDERYQRSDEFLTICRAFWGGGGPVDFAGKYYRIEGGRLGPPFVSAERRGAGDLRRRRAEARRRGGRGGEGGVRLSRIAGPSREEALAAAAALLAEGGE